MSLDCKKCGADLHSEDHKNLKYLQCEFCGAKALNPDYVDLPEIVEAKSVHPGRPVHIEPIQPTGSPFVGHTPPNERPSTGSSVVNVLLTLVGLMFLFVFGGCFFCIFLGSISSQSSNSSESGRTVSAPLRFRDHFHMRDHLRKVARTMEKELERKKVLYDEKDGNELLARNLNLEFPIRYELLTDRTFQIRVAGKDRKFCTGDDVVCMEYVSTNGGIKDLKTISTFKDAYELFQNSYSPFHQCRALNWLVENKEALSKTQLQTIEKKLLEYLRYSQEHYKNESVQKYVTLANLKNDPKGMFAFSEEIEKRQLWSVLVILVDQMGMFDMKQEAFHYLNHGQKEVTKEIDRLLIQWDIPRSMVLDLCVADLEKPDRALKSLDRIKILPISDQRKVDIGRKVLKRIEGKLVSMRFGRRVTQSAGADLVKALVKRFGCKELVPELIHGVSHSEYPLDYARVLAETGDQRGLKYLCSLLKEREHRYRSIGGILKKAGPKVEPFLLEELKLGSVNQEEMIEILAKVGTEKSLPYLKSLAKESDEKLTASLTEAIKEIEKAKRTL